MNVSKTKQRLLLICPGRGSYNRGELNYFDRYRHHKNGEAALQILQQADALRTALDLPTISELDAADRFSPSKHLKGEHAAPLIFTASIADASLLSSQQYDIAAVLGNSMGFYTALVLSGALSFEDGFNLVQTMGSVAVRGAQVIYPVVDDDWRPQPERQQALQQAMHSIHAETGGYVLYSSIHLGGYEVIAGTTEACQSLMQLLPKIKSGRNEYPFQLAGHSAFHTPVMQYASDHGVAALSKLSWSSPKTHLIDGRGAIWRPRIGHPGALADYTLTAQVTSTFDFSASVMMGLKEFAPDRVVLLGPGETLGGSIAQVMIAERWQNCHDKESFLQQQSETPYLLNMARDEHRDFIMNT